VSYLRHLRWLGIVASVVLFVYVVARADPKLIFANMRLLGWNFALLVILSGFRNYLRALAWSFCVPLAERRPAAANLFTARLVSEALNDALPLGPVLGETAKIIGISRIIPAQPGAASVLIENLVYVLAALSFMLTGIALALVSHTTPRTFQWVTAGLAVLLCAVALITRRMKRCQTSVLGGILDSLGRLGLKRGFLDRHRALVLKVEQDVCAFFTAHWALFPFVFAIEFATNLPGIAEAYLVLRVTAAHASFRAAYLVEAAGRAVQLVFAFLPFQLGVQEGVAAATLQALGYAATEGVSLALLRKMRTVIWTALGLLLAARYVMPPRTREEHTLL
jgi:hypothetical protein